MQAGGFNRLSVWQSFSVHIEKVTNGLMVRNKILILLEIIKQLKNKIKTDKGFLIS